MTLFIEELASNLFSSALTAAKLEQWEIAFGLGFLGGIAFFARKLGVLYWLPVVITLLLLIGGYFLIGIIV